MKIQRSESRVSLTIEKKDNQAGVALERVKRSRMNFSHVSGR